MLPGLNNLLQQIKKLYIYFQSFYQAGKHKTIRQKNDDTIPVILLQWYKKNILNLEERFLLTLVNMSLFLLYCVTSIA